jgi:hypothetical protein
MNAREVVARTLAQSYSDDRKWGDLADDVLAALQEHWTSAAELLRVWAVIEKPGLCTPLTVISALFEEEKP